MAPTADSLKTPTKYSMALSIVFAILALISIGSTLKLILPRQSVFCQKPPNVLKCDSIFVYDLSDDISEMVGFAVFARNPYAKSNIVKTPEIKGEQLVNFGEDLAWFGTFNLSKMIINPKATFTFERENTTSFFDSCPTRISIELECPDLYTALLENSQFFWRLKAIPTIKNEENVLPSMENRSTDKKDKELVSAAYKSTDNEFHASFDFFIAFKNPYLYEVRNVSRLPMVESDKFVFMGRVIAFFGTSKRGEGLTEILLSFTGKNSTDVGYARLKCGDMEKEIQQNSVEHFDRLLKLRTLKCLSVGTIALVISLLLGILCGDRYARIAMIEAL